MYALCSRKTQVLYIAMLEKICELAPDLRVYLSIVHGDFEQAAINAVKEIFGESVRYVGCWFHYNQVSYIIEKNIYSIISVAF